MIIKRFNESNEDYNLGILSDIFHSLDDVHNVKILLNKFKIDDIKVKSSSYDCPHYADLISNVIDKLEDVRISPNYIKSYIENGSYHKQFNQRPLNEWDSSDACHLSNETNLLIEKYRNSSFYRVYISPRFNTNNDYKESKKLLKDIKDLLSITKSYNLSLVFSYSLEWITPFGEAVLIFV